MTDLIEPTTAAQMWIDTKKDEWADATHDLQQYHVEQFTEWLSADGIDNMEDVTARTVHRYRLGIKGNIAQSTLSQRVATARRFLRFCVGIDAVPTEVSEKVEMPNYDGAVRDGRLDADTADAVLSYLERYEYASRRHALVALCWHTGFRTGTVVAVDVEDVEIEDERINVRHRPHHGTPLKNGEAAERYVTISDDVSEILADYIEHNRPATEDEYSRDPLFSTEFGRAPIKTVRRWL